MTSQMWGELCISEIKKEKVTEYVKWFYLFQ